MKFCGECGSPQAQNCGKCGFANPPNFKFCGQCGNALAGELTPAPPPPSPPKKKKKKEAERRHLTVMFCDLVGSTALSQRMDAEVFRQVILDYQAVAEEVIQQYNGHIAQYLGDGLMVYFGYPVAMEEPALMSVRCGLHLLEAIEYANVKWAEQGKTTIQVRIGVHAGLVVVDDHLALGDACNIASRLQDLAQPGTMVISSRILRLVGGRFSTTGKGKHQLKGVTKPMEVFTVNEENTGEDSLAGVDRLGTVPLVGRKKEIIQLLEAWENAKEGKGSVVQVFGEAGLGKSRMIRETVREIKQTKDIHRIQFNCSSYHQNSAFHPVLDLLRTSILSFDRKDSDPEKLEKIEAFLLERKFNPETNLPLLAELLSVPLSGSKYNLFGISPEEQKQRTLQFLIRLITKRSETNQVFIVFEDIHWADPSTMEFIDMTIEIPPELGVLVVLTYRPQFVPSWAEREHLQYLELKNFTREETLETISKVCQGKSLPSEVREQIVEKSDGIPLFVEESTKMVIESGLLREEQSRYVLTGPLPPLAIPTTLQDSLIARLERYSGAKEVIQLASILGRRFNYDLLSATGLIEPSALNHYLKSLVHSGLFYQNGIPPDAEYQFRHSLMQNASYQSMLRSRRQQLHQRVAMVLSERFPEIVRTQPEIAARHFTEAGLKEEALGYWQKAAEWALKNSAYVEAARHIQTGLKLTSTMPEGDNKVQFELAFQVRNSAIVKIQDGWSSERVKKVYDKCFELCKQLGDSEEFFTTMFGIWAYYLIGGNITESYRLAQECQTLTEPIDDFGVRMNAEIMMGNSLFWLARYAEAEESFQRAYGYEHQADLGKLAGFGQDSRFIIYMLHCWTAWMSGDVELADQINRKSLDLARTLEHSFSQAIAHCTAAWYYQFNHDIEGTLEHARKCIDLGFAAYQSWGYMLEGWATAMNGRPFDGLRSVKYGFQMLKDQGSGLESYPAVLLAETALRCKKYPLASEYVEMGLRAVETNREMVFAAELQRLGAIAALHEADNKQVNHEDFRRAVVTAQRDECAIVQYRSLASWQQAIGTVGEPAPEVTAELEAYRQQLQLPDTYLDKYLKWETNPTTAT